MSSKWFPKIESEEIAVNMAKQGMYAALAFTAMNVLGLIFAYTTNQSVSDRSLLNADDLLMMLLGAAVLIPIQLFMAFRIYKGKGWLASIILVIWFLIEIVTKALGGTASPAWFIFYLIMIGSLANGFRGCWYFRNNQPTYSVNDSSNS